MKISVIDSWNGKFTANLVKRWRSMGHEVNTSIYWGPQLVEGYDLVLFYVVDNNIIQASRKQEKPKDTFILAEAVDIDIYAGHPGAVSWEYADALMFMADHMREYAEGKFKFPASLPIHTVPGGVDMEEFTLRQKPRGFNVAWVGRYWIAKNLFGALQIFNQLLNTDPGKPWKLFVRGDGWSPKDWWPRHVDAYLDANPHLKERVEFVPQVTDMNAWLDDMDYLLQTSFKEAFGYCVAEAAAKGIKPIIQMTLGADKIWPKEWIFQTHDKAALMFMDKYKPAEYRKFIDEHYNVDDRIKRIFEISRTG